MKKILTILLIAAMTFGLVACSGSGEKTAKVEGSLEEIMDKVYAGIPSENLPMMLENQVVNEETEEWFLGTTDANYKEALARESMVGSIAHSVVLLRNNDGGDVEALKDTIKSSINTNKWICVGIPQEELIVDNIGDLVIVIMADSSIAPTLHENFTNLAK